MFGLVVYGDGHYLVRRQREMGIRDSTDRDSISSKQNTLAGTKDVPGHDAAREASQATITTASQIQMPRLGLNTAPHGPYLSNANGTGPVPYTHPRAHETVLDLVCRLLLEKKKK